VFTPSKGRTNQRPPGRAQPQTRGRGRPDLFGKGVRAPPKHRGPQPRSRLRCGSTTGTNGHPVPSGCPPGRRGLCRSRGPSPCSVLAAQVQVASAGKYDGMSNPSEFLQVYVTAITAAGGNTAVMATYFHVALSRPARTWLMNLAPGSIYSWEELCTRFVVNFASTYQ
jgi:hypothetical protein